MDKPTSDTVKNVKTSIENKFAGVTRYLQSKDIKLIGDDVEFLKLPKNWNLKFKNDNERRSEG